MAIEDDLFDLGIVPYPTEFPNEDDVIQSINNELFELADVGFVSDEDAVSQILDFEKSVVQENSIDDFSSINTPTDFISQSSKNVSANDAVDGWHSVSYAYGLANSQFRPKLKFMFYVDFMLKPEFSELANEFWARNMSFNAKTVDRPKLSFEFEDINQYNFKTKVVKGSKYEDVSITFYDDSSNSVIACAHVADCIDDVRLCQAVSWWGAFTIYYNLDVDRSDIWSYLVSIKTLEVWLWKTK